MNTPSYAVIYLAEHTADSPAGLRPRSGWYKLGDIREAKQIGTFTANVE